MQIRLNKRLTPLQGGILIAMLFINTSVYADSLSLTETQTEKVKCVNKKDTQTKITYKECSKLSTGTYAATAKISLKTLQFRYPVIYANMLSQFMKTGSPFLATAPLGFSISDFGFLGSLATANIKTKTSGTWYISRHCAKLDASGHCINNKQIIDGTLVLSGDQNGVTVKLTGTSDAILNFGKSLFNKTCAEKGTSKQTSIATVTISDVKLNLPINVSCNVTTTTKANLANASQPFSLVNMKITGKLAPYL